jgi:PAS domain S-box-containing protein
MKSPFYQTGKRCDSVNSELDALRQRAAELEATMAAIQCGEVDAVVVQGPAGAQVYTLRRADHGYRVLVEAMGEGAALIDRDGLITYCNPALEKLSQRSIETLVGSSLSDMLVEGDALPNAFATVFEAGNVTREFTLRDGKGRTLPVQLTLSLVPRDDGSDLCAVFADLRLRFRTEALLESERLFRGVMEQSGEAILACDRNGVVLRANDVARRLCHCELESRPLARALPVRLDSGAPQPGGAAELRRRIEAVMGKDSPVRGLAATIIDSDEQTHHLLLSATPLHDNQGRVIGCVLVLTDVSAMRSAQEALRESEQRFRTIFEQAAVGVALIESKTGRFLRINHRYCEIVGYSIEEMAERKTFHEITYPDDLQSDLDNMARLLAGEIREFTMEKRYCRKDDSIVWVKLTVSPTWNPGEEPTHHIAVVEDVTERRQVEEQVRERDAQLAHTDRLSTLGELATSIAHELNQPLAAIVSYAEGISCRVKSRDENDGDLLAALKQISALSKRASDIIRGLRSLVRKDRGALERLQVNEIVNETLQLLGPQARKKGITLDVKLEPGLPSVWGNGVQLEQVVLNLARNSIDALDQSSAEERAMTLRTFTNASNEVELTVSDTGIGLTQDGSTNIFDAFISTKPDGMGLGLSISRTIVEAHAGRIWATANLPRGATFHVALPVAKGFDLYDSIKPLWQRT